MDTSYEPKVTGLSPMTGPPGTKITVRGENLGRSSDDIISVTINGADCLPYLEWKSSKKIITRCTKAIGKGDVLITTSSGGVGSCDVKFDCHDQVIGPTDESAIWVEELDQGIPEKEILTVPGSKGEFSIDISSPRFNPQLYILHKYKDRSLIELDQAHKTLVADLATKSDPERISSSSNRAAMLKANLPVIMECLQILEHLSKVIAISRDTSVDNIVKSIQESLSKTHELFDPLLAQRDLIQSIESAMQVFRQNETLFNLPSAIETSIRTRNYDMVVKEISGVLMRLDSIDLDFELTEKIRRDVTSKVEELRATIESQLHDNCLCTYEKRNVDEVKRLIVHLNRLGNLNNFGLWNAISEMSSSLSNGLLSKYNHYLKLTLDEKSKPERGKLIAANITITPITSSSQDKDESPFVVRFVQDAITMFNNTYYDMLSLGQSYFDPKDEFYCKESDDVRGSRSVEFEENIVTKSIADLVNLLRSALDPNSRKLDQPSSWPSIETQAYINWLQHVLQSVIACHNHLRKVQIPKTAGPALEDFKEFVFELRVRSMKILFDNATRINKNLHQQEDWSVDVDDSYGGRTNLPFTFEKNVIDTLKFANEAIFKPSSPDERSILKRIDVQGTMKGLVQSIINSFTDSLEKALYDIKEHPAELNRMLMASREPSQLPSNHRNRLLITICNCQFTRDQIFSRLKEEFDRRLSVFDQGLKMDQVFKACSTKYTEYIAKKSDKFCQDVLSNKQLSEIELMMINAQIFLIAPQLVNQLMTTIVTSLATSYTAKPSSSKPKSTTANTTTSIHL